MSLELNRIMLTPNEWTQICESEDVNVTVENFGVGAYQTVMIIAGSEPPEGADPGMNYRMLRPQLSQTFTNLDEGTVLWARSVSQDTPIEVIAGG